MHLPYRAQQGIYHRAQPITNERTIRLLFEKAREGVHGGHTPRLPPWGDADRLARRLGEDPRKLVHAEVADLFACDARHVMVFFPDLLGIEESDNVPSTVAPDRWSLRVPPDWLERHRAGLAAGNVLDLSLALGLALRTRTGDAQGPLVARLVSRASTLWPDVLGFPAVRT